jgi:lycopene cyclase domain-containing protein
MGGYLAALLFSLCGLVILDRRLQLVWWNNKKATRIVFLYVLVFFVLWDIAGIVLDIFFVGDTRFLVGLTFKDFPVEELFFLTLLLYSTLISYTLVKRRFRA